MTTASFLHWLCGQVLGPPAYGSHWFCPKCDGSVPSLSLRAHRGGRQPKHVPSFSVRPPRDDLPIKFCCHRCGWWGDEHDLLKFVHGIRDYGMRLYALESLRARFETENHGEIDRPAGSKKRRT